MSADAEKPFEATPHRVDRARREGNVARSSEFAANAGFAGAAFGVAAIAPGFGAGVSQAIAGAARGAAPWLACLALLALAVVPVACAAVTGCLAALLQNGGVNVVPPAPKLERLDPVAGIKRMCSRETLAHAARAALAFAVATCAMVPAIVASAGEMLHAAGPAAVAAAARHAVQHVVAAACLTGSAFALAEYGAARTAWLRTLRMSFEERKRESKEQDGDPFARGRRRAMHRGLLRGAIGAVEKAAFVVANPTHVAVALEYAPPAVPVPRVLVLAAGETALRVRAMAIACRIPIVENVALARALYRDARAGEPIAAAHYVAVAEIVAALQRAQALP